MLLRAEILRGISLKNIDEVVVLFSAMEADGEVVELSVAMMDEVQSSAVRARRVR